MTDIGKFAQDLGDLIWHRERLNADLKHQLGETKQLADAVTRLTALNEEAKDIVATVLTNLMPRPFFPEEDPHTAEIARQYAPPANGSEALRKVANGSYGMN